MELRTASGPQATERGAKEEACERSEAGGQSPMGHHVAADFAVIKNRRKPVFFGSMSNVGVEQITNKK